MGKDIVITFLSQETSKAASSFAFWSKFIFHLFTHVHVSFPGFVQLEFTFLTWLKNAVFMQVRSLLLAQIPNELCGILYLATEENVK